jgi:hypothetical protein
MAISTRALQFAQISNAEGTPGTAEAATAVLLFENLNQILHDKVFHTPMHDRGLLATHIEVPFQVSQLCEFECEGDLYDQLMVYMALNSIRGNVTATQPDDMNEPNHYLWTIEPGQTTQNTPDITNGIDTFTLEYGGNVQDYETEFIFTTSLEISGEVNEPVRFAWSFQGRQVTEASRTGALTAPTTHQFFATNKAKWYVEADAYANIGTTQKSGVLKAFSWTFETGFTARFAADGNYYYAALNEDRKHVELELTLWRDSTVHEAELDAFQSQAIRYMRIALEAETEMDSGQGNPPYIYLDGAFRYTEFPELDDEDGTSVMTATAVSVYDTTAAKQFGVLIGTELDALP